MVTMKLADAATTTKRAATGAGLSSEANRAAPILASDEGEDNDDAAYQVTRQTSRNFNARASASREQQQQEEEQAEEGEDEDEDPDVSHS